MTPHELIVKIITAFGVTGDTSAPAQVKELADNTRDAAAAAEQHAKAAQQQNTAVGSLTAALREQNAAMQSAATMGRSNPGAQSDRSEEARNTAEIQAAKDRAADAADANTWRTMGVEAKKTSNEMESAARAAWAMRMAANGSTEGFRGLTTTAISLGGTLGSLFAKVSAIGVAFTAGWKVGSVIRQHLIDPLIEATGKTDAASVAALEAARKYRELNSTSFAKLVKELSDIEAKTSDIIGAIDRAYSRQKELEAAQSNSTVAGILATEPEGPDRDKRVAQETYRQKLQESERTKGAAEKTIAMNQAALDAADRKIAELSAALDLAQGNRGAALASGRQLSGQEAGQYRLAVENAQKALKDAGDEKRRLQESISESTQDAQNRIDIAAENAKEAKFRFDTQIAEADARKEAESPQSHTESPRTVRAALESSVAPAYRDAAGQVHRGGQIGVETQRAAQAAIAEAANAIGNGGDREDIVAALTEKLRQMNAVLTTNKREYEALWDRVEAIAVDLGNAKSRERVAKGLD